MKFFAETWSSGPGHRQSAMPWICCKRQRNDGILECWNTGFSGLGSIFITMALISL